MSPLFNSITNHLNNKLWSQLFNEFLIKKLFTQSINEATNSQNLLQ